MGSYNFDSHNVERYICANTTDCYSEPVSDVLVTYASDIFWPLARRHVHQFKSYRLRVGCTNDISIHGIGQAFLKPRKPY